MSATAPDVVRSLYAAFAKNDGAAIVALLDPQTVWTLHAPPSQPYGGTFRNVEGALKFLTALGASVDVLDLGADEFITEGDLVTVVGHETIRAKATGKTVSHRWVQLFEVKAGEILRFEEFYDSAKVLAIFQR